MASQIQNASHKIGPGARQKFCWLFHPERISFLGLAGETHIIYECYDQYEAIPGLDAETKSRYRQHDMELLRQSDVVLVTSETLLQEKKQYTKRIALMTNAADVDFFARVQSPEVPLAGPVENLKHPVIGYMGTIHRETDIGLLKYVAERRPDWTIALIGPELDREFSSSELFSSFRELPNVRLFGWVEQADIPGYCKAFDVCLIPYRTDSEFNKYVNPNKLHEYTAMGKPVVSTDIPCVYSHRDIIKIAKSPDEFVAAVEAAIKEDSPALIAERLRRAQENSWAKRAAAIRDILRQTIEKKGPEAT